MSTRLRLLLPACAAVAAVTLTGCGGDSSTSSSTSSSSGLATASGSGSSSAAPAGPVSSYDTVKVSGGDAKTAPTVDFTKKPVGASAFASKVVKEGSGNAATEKDIAVIDYTIYNGTSGAKIDSNWGTPTGFDLSDTSVIPGLRKALLGAKKGAQMIAALPPSEAFGDQGNAQLGIKGTDTLVMVYDVADMITPLANAEGTEEKLDAKLPKVTWNDGKPATFEMPKSDPPKDLVIQPLIKGSGAKVKDGQTAVVTYTGAIWKDGKVFDSSFNHGGKFSFPVGQSKVIKGWDKGVVGQPVGSRLLLVVPPKEGYGDAGSGDIKGTDTIVFVVDILAAY